MNTNEISVTPARSSRQCRPYGEGLAKDYLFGANVGRESWRGSRAWGPLRTLAITISLAVQIEKIYEIFGCLGRVFFTLPVGILPT